MASVTLLHSLKLTHHPYSPSLTRWKLRNALYTLSSSLIILPGPLADDIREKKKKERYWLPPLSTNLLLFYYLFFVKLHALS